LDSVTDRPAIGGAAAGLSFTDRLLGGALRLHGRLTRRFGLVGFRQSASLIRRLRRGQGLIGVQLNADSTFTFPLADRYWSQPMLVATEPYEPEIAWLLRSAAGRPYALLDCGANMGYWSILASSGAYGRHPAVAIEAAHENVALLQLNARANGGRFRIVHRAIAETSGQTVRLYGSRHDAHSLRPDWNEIGNTAASQDVETISLDDAAAQFLPDCSFPPLVKLDVEGVEIEALKGAGGLRTEGALFVYEDHAKERDHPVTTFVFSLGDMEIWSLEAQSRPVRVSTLQQVTAIKTTPGRGYNFFAFRTGSPWASLFQQA
jgi:FkbM family methyltransferase